MRLADCLAPEDFIPDAPASARRELRRLLRDQGAGALSVASDWLEDHGHPCGAEKLRAIATFRPARWWTLADIRLASLAEGLHWFHAGTMRFWGTRLCPGTVSIGPGGIYFVTSDRMSAGRRAYTVRHFCPASRQVVTADRKLGAHKTRRAATKAALRYSAFGAPQL